MSARENAFAPRAQKISVAIEHHHRVLTTIEDIDIVLLVDTDRADFAQRPAWWDLGPVVDLLVAVVALTDDVRHPTLLLI